MIISLHILPPTTTNKHDMTARLNTKLRVRTRWVVLRDDTRRAEGEKENWKKKKTEEKTIDEYNEHCNMKITNLLVTVQYTHL